LTKSLSARLSSSRIIELMIGGAQWQEWLRMLGSAACVLNCA